MPTSITSEQQGDIKRSTGAKVLLHKGDKELYKGVRDQAAFLGL